VKTLDIAREIHARETRYSIPFHSDDFAHTILNILLLLLLHDIENALEQEGDNFGV
jgi:hypothetical protein